MIHPDTRIFTHYSHRLRQINTERSSTPCSVVHIHTYSITSPIAFHTDTNKQTLDPNVLSTETLHDYSQSSNYTTYRDIHTPMTNGDNQGGEGGISHSNKRSITQCKHLPRDCTTPLIRCSTRTIMDVSQLR